MYGMIAHVPFRGMIKKQVLNMMTDLYGPHCKMPALESGSDKQPWLMRVLPIILKFFQRLR